MSSSNGAQDSTDTADQGTPRAASTTTDKPVCFVIMPISDHPDYEPGHFKRVFEDIFEPACNKAGFRAVRADQVGQTNLIHLDVLQKLIASPMVLCDLSSRNPNVLFELGLRQAFDKPVVLVREIGTPDIFDIAPLRYAEYRKERIYHQVLQDQKKITNAILETQRAFQNDEGVNSIVRLLSLTQPATLPDVREADKDPVLQIVRAELSEMRVEFREALRFREVASRPRSPVPEERSQHELRRVNSLLSLIEDAVGNMRNGSATPKDIAEIADMFESASRRINWALRTTDNIEVVSALLAFQSRLGAAEAAYKTLKVEEELDLREEDFDDIPF